MPVVHAVGRSALLPPLVGGGVQRPIHVDGVPVPLGGVEGARAVDVVGVPLQFGGLQ